MPINGAERRAKGRPYPIIIDPACHDENQHLIGTYFPSGNHFQLHGRIRIAMALLPDRPSMHAGRHMAERGNFTDFVKVFNGHGVLQTAQILSRRESGYVAPHQLSRAKTSHFWLILV